MRLSTSEEARNAVDGLHQAAVYMSEERMEEVHLLRKVVLRQDFEQSVRRRWPGGG